MLPRSSPRLRDHGDFWIRDEEALGDTAMNSKIKGKRGELDFAAALKELGFDARRGVQYQGGKDSPDVLSDALSRFHFEVKRTEALRLYEAMEQAVAERGDGIPVLAHRRNRGDWLIVMRLEDWVELVR
jgi:Holliday junction resolvase